MFFLFFFFFYTLTLHGYLRKACLRGDVFCLETYFSVCLLVQFDVFAPMCDVSFFFLLVQVDVFSSMCDWA